MPMKNLHNPHPGEILLTEFMEPFELTNYRLAKDLNIPESRVGKIVKGERRITADTALRLEMYFGMDASFWLGLQNDYDLLEEKRLKEKKPLLIKVYEFVSKRAGTFENDKKTAGRTTPVQRKKDRNRNAELN
jgi:addiction module HigA family antidote